MTLLFFFSSSRDEIRVKTLATSSASARLITALILGLEIPIFASNDGSQGSIPSVHPLSVSDYCCVDSAEV